MGISYLYLFKYYQELQMKLEKLEKNKHATGALYCFYYLLKSDEVIDVLQGVDISKISKEIEKKDSYKYEKEIIDLSGQYWDLREYLSAGNLRHVVNFLYKDEGLSTKEFANKLNCSEQEIVNLTRYGKVSNTLLDDICKYFDIIKSQDFIWYVK